jgi:hypothetical protein
MARKERVHIEVNDETIASGDIWAVIRPVWWSVSIYNGPAAYDHDLEKFSEAQKHVFAIRWYISEVTNGGHKQFYSNSTGIVWGDARDGFEAIGLSRAATIIRISADRLGGSPSRDRQERSDQLEEETPDFDDCDEALYQLIKKVDLEQLLMDYIRTRPRDFHFAGEVERVVLPNVTW